MIEGSASHQIGSSVDEDDENTWRSNVRAGKQLADTVRTTLGPKGLDKLLVTSDGKIVVTNDGASILDRINIEHPAAKLVAEVAEQQGSGPGDGTTSAVLLTGELLSEAESLLEQNVHPTKIIEGYHIAASYAKKQLPEQTIPIDTGDDEQLRNIARTVVTGKWDKSGTDFLAKRAVETVRRIERDDRIAFEKITRKTSPGGSFYDSEVIDGLVIDMEESPTDIVSPEAQLPTQYQDATVALIDEELSIDEPTGVGAVNPDSPEGYKDFQEREGRIYDGYVDAIESVGADVVFCQQSIDEPVRYGLAKSGIMAIERTRRDELNKLARSTGAQAVLVEDLTPATVGRASSIERRSVGETDITVVSGIDELDHVSLLFRGGTKHVAEETKRKLDDCFFVLKLAIEDEALLPGGGATEAELARKLRIKSTDYHGKEQLAIESFADALETIPRTLATSAGMTPIDALVELRRAHDSGKHAAGVNLEANTIDDMAEQSVLEPLYVKQRLIGSATEATNMVLRIDDALSVAGHNGDGDEHDHGHEHGPGGMVQSTEGYPWAVGHSMGHDHS
ncbi:thermosome subunit 1 [Natronomonas gomsonensis]|uniref:thermosome subunit alpha n=1 Tax=Natronomonas gomsonensis TaxID=1046043 RepID=UPI00227BC806|nr:thermosome subunit alpha [Natronomonas gomsonensis]MCY4732725.1 thermosome subunit 1 [Natronomonas gomsonensis]